MRTVSLVYQSCSCVNALAHTVVASHLACLSCVCVCVCVCVWPERRPIYIIHNGKRERVSFDPSAGPNEYVIENIDVRQLVCMCVCVYILVSA